MGIKVILSNQITKQNATTDANGSFQFSNVFPEYIKSFHPLITILSLKKANKFIAKLGGLALLYAIRFH